MKRIIIEKRKIPLDKFVELCEDKKLYLDRGENINNKDLNEICDRIEKMNKLGISSDDLYVIAEHAYLYSSNNEKMLSGYNHEENIAFLMHCLNKICITTFMFEYSFE